VVTHATQELGRITQANSVPHGQLPAGWPAIAPLIVQAVIDGLSDLARRVAASKS
jgi:hypothetical protein